MRQPSCEVNKSKNHKEILDGALHYMGWLTEMIKCYNLNTQKCPFNSMHFEMAQLIHNYEKLKKVSFKYTVLEEC